jgi:uncharacterized flavoprotein (TIGR03862 family)
MQQNTITIVGAGAAGLFLALALRDSGRDVHLYDQQNAAARKFLVAGDGGLNLTHSEAPASFLNRYTPPEFLRSAFPKFDNVLFQDWLSKHGIPLFIGSSGRVFPEKEWRPAQVLSHLLHFLKDGKTHFHFRHQWKGFDAENNLLFNFQDETLVVPSGITVFALGGASWPVTGSKGDWLSYFSAKGIQVSDFEASNCRFIAELPPALLKANAGKPLKNICLRFGKEKHFGEIVFNDSGVEGSGIYPFSPFIRKALKQDGHALILIDLKPHNTREDLLGSLAETEQTGTWTEKVQKALRIDPVAHRFLKHSCSKEDYLNPLTLVNYAKSVPLKITATGSLEEAISSVGGIALEEVDENFVLHKMHNTYVLGEMLNYDAPTGGYLLQSCFSMAMQVAEHIKNRTI